MLLNAVLLCAWQLPLLISVTWAHSSNPLHTAAVVDGWDRQTNKQIRTVT